MTKPAAYWHSNDGEPAFDPPRIQQCMTEFRGEHFVVRHPHQPALGVATGGETLWLNGGAAGPTCFRCSPRSRRFIPSGSATARFTKRTASASPTWAARWRGASPRSNW